MRFLKTVGAVLALSTFGFIVRWLTGQFTMELNVIIFFALAILVLATWEFLRWLNGRLNVVLPYEQGIPRRIAVQVLLGAAFAFTLRLLVYLFAEPYLTVPLNNLFLVSTWAMYVMLSVILNGIFITIYFIKRWKDTQVNAERLEKEKAQVQFDNLKNQLNPHFLFNALASLNSLISENPILASQFLQHMSKVYRYVLQNKEKNFVGLETELKFIENYVFLAVTRFGDALTIRFNLDASVREKAIVPVTLQILIENALKHNVIESSRPLSIEVLAEGDYLVVRNNLQQKKIVESSNKQGLDNLRSLYRFLTEKPVVIEQNDHHFSVKVPLL